MLSKCQNPEDDEGTDGNSYPSKSQVIRKNVKHIHIIEGRYVLLSSCDHLKNPRGKEIYFHLQIMIPIPKSPTHQHVSSSACSDLNSPFQDRLLICYPHKHLSEPSVKLCSLSSSCLVCLPEHRPSRPAPLCLWMGTSSAL